MPQSGARRRDATVRVRCRSASPRPMPPDGTRARASCTISVVKGRRAWRRRAQRIMDVNQPTVARDPATGDRGLAFDVDHHAVRRLAAVDERGEQDAIDRRAPSRPPASTRAALPSSMTNRSVCSSATRSIGRTLASADGEGRRRPPQRRRRARAPPHLIERAGHSSSRCALMERHAGLARIGAAPAACLGGERRGRRAGSSDTPSTAG